jgi:hypothetical protein
MQTSFYILCAQTVPENYTWDVGVPFDGSVATTVSVTDSTTTYVSGYAPGVRVVFQNSSIPEIGFDNITYNWNFGDYYNDTNNFASLSCISSIDHVYVMPGTYRVTLGLVQTKSKETLGTGNDLLCRGTYSSDLNPFRWFWNDLNFGDVNAKTWDETRNGAPFQKQWADELQCFQKHCTLWSWQDLQNVYPTIWGDTQSGADKEKKWMFEENDTVCSVNAASFLQTTGKIEQTVTTTEIVVKEKPPIAGMYCMTRPAAGYTPFTVRLTPRTTQTGSFPIDRIDWNFGDGSPIKTVTRFAPPSGADIVVNDILNPAAFPNDPDDVRNFDILHTYTVNRDTYPVFYPSLTCYSACTNTADSCCITIGPITLSSHPTETHLVKARNTLKGNVYTFNVDGNVAFTTTTLTTAQSNIVAYNVPTTNVRDSYGALQVYFGNPGTNYPPSYTIDCGSRPDDLTTFIATESATVVSSVMISSVPINTEYDLTFIP